MINKMALEMWNFIRDNNMNAMSFEDIENELDKIEQKYNRD